MTRALLSGLYDHLIRRQHEVLKADPPTEGQLRRLREARAAYIGEAERWCRLTTAAELAAKMPYETNRRGGE